MIHEERITWGSEESFSLFLEGSNEKSLLFSYSGSDKKKEKRKKKRKENVVLIAA